MVSLTLWDIGLQERKGCPYAMHILQAVRNASQLNGDRTIVSNGRVVSKGGTHREGSHRKGVNVTLFEGPTTRIVSL